MGPYFERTTGHKLVIDFAPSAVFLQRIEGGQTFDVAVLFPSTIDGWIKQGKVVAATRTDIARVPTGLGIRSGATKSDVRSVDAFKQTLLSAGTVSYSAEGAAGKHFTAVLERLGIADEMKAKLRPVAAGRTSVEVLAKGEAEIAVALVPAILSTPGIALVGPFPSELQYYVELTAGVSSDAKDAEAAKAFVNFLAAAEPTSVINAKGMERFPR